MTDLPNDLLVVIFFYIQIQDLLTTVNRVCRRFYELIKYTPVLWSVVHLDYPLKVSKENLEVLLTYSTKKKTLLLPCTSVLCNIPETDWLFTTVNFKTLVWLDLTDVRISTLCFLYSAPQLKTLNVSGCKQLIDEDFLVLKSCQKLEQIYVSFTNIAPETLELICQNKALIVVDACDVHLQLDQCRNILANTVGHIVYLHISLHSSVVEEDFKVQISNLFLDTSIKIFKR